MKTTRRNFLKLFFGLPFLNLASFAQVPAAERQARPWAFTKKRGDGRGFSAYFAKERPRHKVYLPLKVRNG